MRDKVLLDANIVLELFFERVRRMAVLSTLEELKNTAEVYISSLSVSHFMYFVEVDKQSKVVAGNFIRQFPVLGVDAEDVSWALQNDQGDFEDALQVACALRHGCKKLITLDKDLPKLHNKHIDIQLII